MTGWIVFSKQGVTRAMGPLTFEQAQEFWALNDNVRHPIKPGVMIWELDHDFESEFVFELPAGLDPEKVEPYSGGEL